MVDAHYTHPDLVALYDVFNDWGADRDFYAALAGDQPIRVLEVGCGTGLIARRIAKRGHDVVGLDPAPQMLAYAQAAPGGKKVEWVHGLLADYQGQPFDLIYMTGHAFQCILSDGDIAAFFQSAHRLLRSNGRLVFETRNPMRKAWENWTRFGWSATKVLSDGRTVKNWHEVTAVQGALVSFQSFYQFPDQCLTSASTLRFVTLDELRVFAVEAKLEVLETYGDWDKSPFDADSPEIIVTLGKA